MSSIFGDFQAIKIRSGIMAGEEVSNGYAGQYCTAPEAPGTYTLYQLVDPESRTHAGFIFKREA